VPLCDYQLYDNGRSDGRIPVTAFAIGIWLCADARMNACRPAASALPLVPRIPGSHAVCRSSYARDVIVKINKNSADDNDAGVSSQQDAYWLEMPDGVFVLKADGKTRASVVMDFNAGEIMRGDGHRSISVVPLDSEVVFDVVETQLGLGPVTNFRALSGPCRTDWRTVAEQRAERFRKAHPPRTEAEHYCAAALHFLDHRSQRGLLSSKASEARRNLQQALLSLKAHKRIWTPDACEKLAQAKRALGAEQLDQPLQQPFASLACRKAIAVLERQGILKPPIMALAERANAPAPDQPSQPQDLPDTCWVYSGRGAFSLFLDGRERAQTHHNTVSIIDDETLRPQTIAVLDSETIFDAAEMNLGIAPVTSFAPATEALTRTAFTILAKQFRESHPEKQEPHFYTERALESLLAEQAGPTNSELESARLHLGKALDAFRDSDGLAEAAKQVDHARQYLPALSTSLWGKNANALSAAADCERATRAIERNCSLERGGGELSHAHSTGPSRGRGRH
jgi:hypothetical protein